MSNLVAIAVVLISAIGIGASAASAEPISWEVELRIDKPRNIVPGERLTFCLRAINISRTPATVYNAFFSPGYRYPSARLIMRDGRGQVIGDLLSVDGGTSRWPDSGLWMSVPAGRTVGTDYSVVGGFRPAGGVWREPLAPGIYFVQLELLDRFTSSSPFCPEKSTERAVDEWSRSYYGNVIAVSNSVSIQIVGN